MEISKYTLDQYLEDTYKKINDAHETGNLKMIRDMALGAICFCNRSEVIHDQDRDQYIEDLGKVYSEKWDVLEKNLEISR